MSPGNFHFAPTICQAQLFDKEHAKCHFRCRVDHIDATKACQLTSWEDVNQFDGLAAAYAETGKFDEAVKWLKKALLSPDFPEEDRENACFRLKLYEAGKPYPDE